ncbi:MAG: glycosyltransferase family 39 protein [Methanobrevibacter sp.]|jgi:hypothetical protein|nr:glycosyltransferase family 39 protein [Candidatus Methanovirga australis]
MFDLIKVFDYLNDFKFNINIFSKFLFIISFITFILALLTNYFDNTLRYDEIFTLTLIKNNLSNIVYFTSIDVHPPLHYFIVKCFVEFGHLFHLPFNDIFIGKVSSSTPMLILMVFSYKYLRQDIGELGAGLFSLSLVIMPPFIYYLGDVRMYSWGMLFVTLAFYMAYRITINDSKSNYILLALLTICGLYTQYFCAVALIAVYLVLLAYLSFNNDLNKIKKVFITATISVISFLPWMHFVLNQTSTVVNQFWIGSFDSDTLIEYIWYFLSSLKFGESSWDLFDNHIVGWDIIFLAILMLIVIEVVIFEVYEYYINNRIMNLFKLNFLVFGALIIVCETILGVMIGIAIGKPVLHVRYLFISLALFWLSICIIISRIKNNIIFWACLALFLIGGGISGYYGLNITYGNHYHSQDLQNVLSMIGPDDLIIDDALYLTGERELITHYSDENSYVANLDKFSEPIFINLYSHIHTLNSFNISTFKKIGNVLKSGHKVWIMSQDQLFSLYWIKNHEYKFLDKYHVKTYKISHSITSNYFTKFVTEISG